MKLVKEQIYWKRRLNAYAPTNPEIDNQLRIKIMHRIWKPNNVLISEQLKSKIRYQYENI